MNYLKSCIDNNKMLSRNFFLGFRYTGLKLVTDIKYLSMLSKLFSFAGFVTDTIYRKSKRWGARAQPQKGLTCIIM